MRDQLHATAALALAKKPPFKLKSKLRGPRSQSGSFEEGILVPLPEIEAQILQPLGQTLHPLSYSWSSGYARQRKIF
jgi:hypothetical protein